MDAAKRIKEEKCSTLLGTIVGAMPLHKTTSSGGNLSVASTVNGMQSPASSGTNSDSEKDVLFVRETRDFYRVKATTRTIRTAANVCNDIHINSWTLDAYLQLRALSVGSNSFRNVSNLRLDGFSKLESIEIGKGCFTLCEDPPKSYSNTSFIISSCPALKTLRIGAMSFADWGEFQLSSTMNEWN